MPDIMFDSLLDPSVQRGRESQTVKQMPTSNEGQGTSSSSHQLRVHDEGVAVTHVVAEHRASHELKVRSHPPFGLGFTLSSDGSIFWLFGCGNMMARDGI
jgi:hypothetical protein